MSKRTDREFLSDIREAIHRIQTYVKGMAYEAFLTDTMAQDAVIRNLEILGEATKNLSEELRVEHPGLPWKGMAGVRDRLIHHYFGVNLDIVWQVATSDLPQIASQLQSIEEEKQ